jgi:hypothetical protein
VVWHDEDGSDDGEEVEEEEEVEGSDDEEGSQAEGDDGSEGSDEEEEEEEEVCGSFIRALLPHCVVSLLYCASCAFLAVLNCHPVYGHYCAANFLLDIVATRLSAVSMLWTAC